MRLVLASNSARRRELLERAGVRFEVQSSDVAENVEPHWDPERAARELARRKALAVARERRQRGQMDCLVLGADTIVGFPLCAVPRTASDWRPLGKPADASEARATLRLLSASRHLVVTGLCAVHSGDLDCRLDSERTWVSMRAWSEAEIESYVAGGVWRDMAGGYGIQAGADQFVCQLEGAYDNVVGLPVERALALVRTLGAWDDSAG